MKIVTEYNPPPIPVRDHDWSAIDWDTYDEGAPIGWGKTEQEAIADLMMQLEDRDEQEQDNKGPPHT